MNEPKNQESESLNELDDAGLKSEATANNLADPAEAQEPNLEITDEEEGPTVIDELAQAQAEIANLKDGFLRAKAEQDNIRRRSEKEVANSRKFAVEGFAKELLNVRDSLVLASSVELNEDTNETVKGIHQGVEITLKQLDAAFAKFALVAVTPETGDKLDPNIHQAMSLVESDQVESGHILSVIQTGFTLHERLLRPAMVIVAK